MSERATYILPRDKGAAPLDFVIAVMAFLAALALGASLVADRAAQGWQSGLSDRMTIQIMPPEQGDARAGLDAETGSGLAVLNATPASPMPGFCRTPRSTPWSNPGSARTEWWRAFPCHG